MGRTSKYGHGDPGRDKDHALRFQMNPQEWLRERLDEYPLEADTPLEAVLALIDKVLKKRKESYPDMDDRLMRIAVGEYLAKLTSSEEPKSEG